MTDLEKMQAILDDLGIQFDLRHTATDKSWTVSLNTRELRFGEDGRFLGFMVENEWRAYLAAADGSHANVTRDISVTDSV